MTIYEIPYTSTTTTFHPWMNTGASTYYPYVWTTPPHAQKCVNCGYCSCCGKSDIPGKLTPEEE